MKRRVKYTKIKKASEIGGRDYYVCFARGGRPHILLDCWFADEDGNRDNCDWVNIKTGEGPWPYVRKGELIMSDD